MRGRSTIVVLTVTALAVAVFSAFSAVALATTRTLHLTAVVYEHSSKGGVYASKEKVFEGATRVGEDSSRCTAISHSQTRCVGSYTLKQGNITFSGTITIGDNTNRLAIVGGTGAYKDARGTVLTEYNSAGNRAKETLTFK
jgi:hypothetical protein